MNKYSLFYPALSSRNLMNDFNAYADQYLDAINPAESSSANYYPNITMFFDCKTMTGDIWQGEKHLVTASFSTMHCNEVMLNFQIYGKGDSIKALPPPAVQQTANNSAQDALVAKEMKAQKVIDDAQIEQLKN